MLFLAKDRNRASATKGAPKRDPTAAESSALCDEVANSIPKRRVCYVSRSGSGASPRCDRLCTTTFLKGSTGGVERQRRKAKTSLEETTTWKQARNELDAPKMMCFKRFAQWMAATGGIAEGNRPLLGEVLRPRDLEELPCVGCQND